jgi:hypothetical protein
VVKILSQNEEAKIKRLELPNAWIKLGRSHPAARSPNLIQPANNDNPGHHSIGILIDDPSP